MFCILQGILPQTLQNHGCTLEVNLMEINKSIGVRVDRGREDVLEQACGKFLDQRGGLKCGRTPPVINPIPFKKKKCVRGSKKKGNGNREREKKQVKYRKTNDNSQKARSDYARYDGAQGVQDIAKDVPQEYLKEMMLDYYTNNVKISEQRIIDIESVTRGQSTPDDISSNIWLDERRKRITSSNTGAIAKRRATTKVANMVKTVLYSTFRGNIATEWGKLQEPATCEAYIEAKRSSSPAPSVKSSGLVIHPEPHWLAASPDGLVTDPTTPDPTGIVEFKNPYKPLSNPASEAKYFCLTICTKNSSLRLKHSHQYYYQIQAVMFCTGMKWCNFVVRTNVDLLVERVPWDPQFWMSVLPKLHNFYFTAILPELALPRMHTGGIREPKEWLSRPEAWKQQTEVRM